MHRFFLSPSAIKESDVYFPPDLSHQIARVLRLKPGETVIVLDNLGREYLTELDQVDAQETTGRVMTCEAARGEPRAQLTLFLALTQRDKFEWMLQKCTEVGVIRFVPMLTSRTLIQKAADADNKRQRWESILREAAEQCGRGLIPQLLPAVRFAEACRLAALENDLALIAWEEEGRTSASKTIRDCLVSASFRTAKPRVAVMIGGEGGFSPEEVELACQAGLVPVSLGQRILRMETAAIVASALVIEQLG